jgi:hypothetical protein
MYATRYRHWGQRRLLLSATMSALLAACASSPSGSIRDHAATTVTMQHYPLALGEISTGATPRKQPMPVYPSDLLDERLAPVEVAARLIVDTEGKVSEVHIDGEDQAAPQQRQFAEAVRTAAMQWSFEPLRITPWAADANGNTHGVGSQARSFSLEYVFRFAWKDGKPVTEAHATTSIER